MGGLLKSPQRLTRIVAKIKYQLNVEINKIIKNNSINFQKIPDISISIEDKVLTQIKKNSPLPH